VPLLLALAGTSGKRALRLGYLTGVSSAIGLLYWTSLVVIQFGGLSLPVGIGVMLLLCLAFALFHALFGWAAARAFAILGPPGLLLAPFLWVATEVLRAYTFFRFPWCLLGYSQYRYLPVIQIASVTGVYGVSFLIVLTAAVIAFFVHERRPRARLLVAEGFLFLLAAVFTTGLLGLRRSLPESGRVRAGLVQASILQDEKWEPSKELAHFESHVELTMMAAKEGARLIVWPESAVTFPYDYEPAIASRLQDLARRTGAALVFGNDDGETGGDGQTRIWVGAKMLTPRGELAYRYHKNRLVPFGEYVPMKPLLTLGGRFTAQLVRRVGEFEPGTEANVGAFEGHLLGTSVCYEAIFPDFVRLFSVNGAEMLLNITNDGWYGRTSAPHQHFSMAVFRAVENRKWLLRAANTGISAFVDPHGRVVARTQLFERRTLVEEAAFVPGRSLYARYGDVFAGGCFAVSVLALGWTARRRL
jgi:apolipoprotein N-acyltransferase